MFKRGEIAPEFPQGALKTFDGEVLRLEDLTEGGPLVLVFLRGFS